MAHQSRRVALATLPIGVAMVAALTLGASGGATPTARTARRPGVDVLW